MGWKKRKYETLKAQKERGRVSPNSDNRVVCPKTGRPKFLYPTLKKAQLACKYSDDPQRPYYCKRCCGYHTTSETKEEYYDKLEPIVKGRFNKPLIRTKNPRELI